LPVTHRLSLVNEVSTYDRNSVETSATASVTTWTPHQIWGSDLKVSKKEGSQKVSWDPFLNTYFGTEEHFPRENGVEKTLLKKAKVRFSPGFTPVFVKNVPGHRYLLKPRSNGGFLSTFFPLGINVLLSRGESGLQTPDSGSWDSGF